MSLEVEKIVESVLESDFSTKEVCNDTLDEMLSQAGFTVENGVWVKRMAKQAVTVSKIPNGYFSIGYFKRGTIGWIPAARYDSGETGVAEMVTKVRSIPVQEAMSDDFDMKSVYAQDYLSDILRYVDRGILDLGGKVFRHSHHYVHQRSTTFEISDSWNWPDDVPEEEQAEVELRIGKLINRFEEEVVQKIVDWNNKIYKELEAAYDDSNSEPVVAENILANHYTFDQSGRRSDHANLLYNQLNDAAKEKARQWYIEGKDQNDWDWMSEPVILEWKWLLKNKGFESVEINWSGFYSQGDGASFTADSFDFKRYVKGPDPLEFPESERQQIAESQGDTPRIRGEYWITNDGAWFADGDVGDMNHEMYARDYAARRVLDFFKVDCEEDYVDEDTFREAVIEGLEEQQIEADKSNWEALAEQFIEKSAAENKAYLEACFSAARGFGDARDVAVQYFGWIWCRGNNLSTWTYDRSSLLSGVQEVIEQEGGYDDDGTDWSQLDLEIFVASTKRRYSITFGDLESGRTPGHDPTWPVAESSDGNIKDVLGTPPPEPTFTVVSSHGELTARVDDGKVISAKIYTPGDEDGENLGNIVRFDVGEWRKSWQEELEPGSSIDILDMGYWTKQGQYEPPMEDWRREFAAERHKRGKPPTQESADEDAATAKEMYGVNRRSIKNIDTSNDYAEYQARVQEFMEREGIQNLTSVSDADGNVEHYFSWKPCDCCKRPLGGDRVKASGWNPATRQVQEYSICQDCEYYAEYGQLDDMTMMSMKNSHHGLDSTGK